MNPTLRELFALSIGHPPFSEETLARHFGLENLNVGRHWRRDEERNRIGKLSVVSVWQLEVSPSFKPPFVLSVISALGEEFRGSKSPDWIKAVLATREAAGILQLNEDPIGALVNTLTLFQPGGGSSLDGVSYNFVFQTRALYGILKFSNPRQPSLAKFERACFELADKVAGDSKIDVLASVVESWSRQFSHSNPSTPHHI
jgi:hypothetical protein